MILKLHKKEFGLHLDIDGIWVWDDCVQYPTLERMSLIQGHPFWEYSPIELVQLKDIAPMLDINGIRVHRMFSYGGYYDR